MEQTKLAITSALDAQDVFFPTAGDAWREVNEAQKLHSIATFEVSRLAAAPRFTLGSCRSESGERAGPSRGPNLKF